MRSKYICAGIVSLLLLIVSCNGGLKTVTLYPVKTETKTKGKDDNNDFASCGPIPTPVTCGIDHLHGTGCFPKGISSGPTHDPVAAGFGRYYDPGTQPCPCWQYVNCIYRGYVKFDVSNLKGMGIASAVLKWSNNPEIKSDTIAWGKGEDCIKSIAIADTDWNAYSVPGEFLQGNPSAPSLKDSKLVVTQTVLQWINGQRENHGWFFVGESESLGVKDNNDCKAVLSNMRLEVLASDKK